MKLQKFVKNKKQKQILVGSIVGILLVIGGIELYRTFGLYKEEATFNVIRGKVPDFRNDLELAITENGETVEKIPTKEESTYYDVTVQCDKDAIGKWNYNAWNIEVSNFVSGTKCNVEFTVNEEKESYNEVINSNIKTLSVEANAPAKFADQGQTLELDFTTIKGYELLTVNNFMCSMNINQRFYNGGVADIYISNAKAKEYNSSSGNLTVEYQNYFGWNSASPDNRSKVICTCFYS